MRLLPRAFLACCTMASIPAGADPGPLVVWSPTPATSWQNEAYPIGNGKLAAMVFGGVGTDQIQFNEDTVWTGQPHDYGNPNATPAHLASLRARGGFEVNLAWESHRLAAASVVSLLGNPCRVRSRWPISVLSGSNYLDAPLVYPNVYGFPTRAGERYSIVPALIVETENLAAAVGSSSPHSGLTNSAFSGLQGTRLNAGAAGDFVVYTVTNIPAGTWRLQVVADCGSSGGRFQLAGGPEGALADIGPAFDTYSPANVISLYSTNSLAPGSSLLSTTCCASSTAAPGWPLRTALTNSASRWRGGIPPAPAINSPLITSGSPQLRPPRG